MLNQRLQMLTDRLAIVASAACTIHCLLIPVAIVAFPVLAAVSLEDERFHSFLLWFVLPTSMFALILGCRRHKDIVVLGLGALGLALLAASATFGHDVLGEMGERFTTVLGSSALVAGHVRNQSLCRRDNCHN